MEGKWEVCAVREREMYREDRMYAEGRPGCMRESIARWVGGCMRPAAAETEIEWQAGNAAHQPAGILRRSAMEGSARAGEATRRGR